MSTNVVNGNVTFTNFRTQELSSVFGKLMGRSLLIGGLSFVGMTFFAIIVMYMLQLFPAFYSSYQVLVGVATLIIFALVIGSFFMGRNVQKYSKYCKVLIGAYMIFGGLSFGLLFAIYSVNSIVLAIALTGLSLIVMGFIGLKISDKAGMTLTRLVFIGFIVQMVGFLVLTLLSIFVPSFALFFAINGALWYIYLGIGLVLAFGFLISSIWQIKKVSQRQLSDADVSTLQWIYGFQIFLALYMILEYLLMLLGRSR